METNREEILADFQACTGMEDIAECLVYLEESDWVLLDAVNRAMPQTLSADCPPMIGPSNMYDSAMDTSEPPMGVMNQAEAMPLFQPVSLCSDIIHQPSSSMQHRVRMLNFNIEFRGQTVQLVFPDTEKVSTIKDMIHGQLGIPPCGQRLEGWNQRYVSDNTRLSSLNLPKENTLYLQCDDFPPANQDAVVNGDEDELTTKLTREYKLFIRDETNNKTYPLNEHGSKTVHEVKQDLFTVSDISVRHQIWTGWPETASDEVVIANTGIDYPSHYFTVRSSAPSSTNERRKLHTELASDSSAEEFEDANETFPMDDDIYNDSSPKRPSPLMPDDVIDETEALLHFTAEFENRYGECHPMFFQGSLEDALNEVSNKPTAERRPLAVYLHHDSSVLSNVFCSQVLCSETVVSYLSNNFITWAWDLTNDGNRSSLLQTVNRHFGSVAASTIRNFRVEKFPLIFVVMKNRSATEVFSIMHGTSSIDELLTNLIQATDVFTTQHQTELREEEEREARESMKREQDMAYEVSLQADRAKEEVRRQEAAVKEAEERELSMEREREEESRREQLAIKEAMRQSLELSLPPEPGESCSEPVTHIKIRVPSGDPLGRRFFVNNTLGDVLNYLIVKGYDTQEYKVLTSWPRRDLTSDDPSRTLQDLKFVPQEMLTLEEK